MSEQLSFQKLQRWSIRGGLSIFDQGLFSGANFIASILFARWMSPNDYGAFAIVFALYLLLTGFHTAFILEPMSVLGPAKYLGQLPDYFLVQLKLHGIITSLLALFMILIGWLIISMGTGSLGYAFLGAGLGVPFMLLLWYVRRVFYVLGQPVRAFWASALYFFFLMIAVAVFYSIGSLNSFSCFLLLAIASLLSSFICMWRRIGLVQEIQNVKLAWLTLAQEQWLYGRWIAIAALLTFLANQIQLLLLGSFISLQSAGALDALQNFIAPVTQGIMAVSILVLPVISYDYGQSNLAKVQRKIISVMVVLTFIAIVYEMFLLLLPKQLELLLYGGKYSDSVYLIPVLGVIPIFTAVTTGYSLALRAIQRPQFYLYYGMIVAPVGLVTGFFFTYFWGLEGAVLSLLIISLLTLMIHIYFYKNWFLSLMRSQEVTHETK